MLCSSGYKSVKSICVGCTDCRNDRYAWIRLTTSPTSTHTTLIGTGLFLGLGRALAEGGPVGALIAYAFVGTVVSKVHLCCMTKYR